VTAPAREPRCSLTELYVSQCAHCRHIETPSRVATGEFGAVTVARFPGVCASCGGGIVVGEGIAPLLDGGGWACEGCLP
jgi:hypothetical protein